MGQPVCMEKLNVLVGFAGRRKSEPPHIETAHRCLIIILV